MKTLLPAANGLALIATIVVNYLSNTGIFNGNTMETVSDRYSNYFTPAGYAFSIWGLIYLGLLGFVIYTGRSLFTKKEPNAFLPKIAWWFVLSCLANSLWVIAWLYDYTGVSVIIMISLLFFLVKIILNTRMELDEHPLRDYIFVFWPFALYIGWILVALVANTAAWLTKINWDGLGISPQVWTIIMTGAAALINILLIQTRNLRESGMVGIWGIMAISVANNKDAEAVSIVYACYACSLIILIFIIINALKGRQSHEGNR
jgi:heme exporter protein D